jgi:hypothetical protein
MIPRFCRLLIAVTTVLVLAGLISNVRAQSEAPNQSTSQKTPVISGHVYRADTHAPIAKATVTLVPPFVAGNPQFQTAQTGTDGAFAFYDLRPATSTYTSRASAEGFVGQDYSLDGTLDGKFLKLKPGVTFQNVDFYLPVAGVISGSISDEAGTALKNIEVTAVHRKFSPGGDERPVYVMATRTDGEGKFQLKGLMPGSYLIVANGPYGNTIPGNNYSEVYYPNEASFKTAKPLAVSAATETPNIHISVKAEKRYSITAKVSGPAGPDSTARYSYSVHLEDRNTSSTGMLEGPFTIRDIPAGDYTMVAWGQDSAHKFVALSKTPIHVADADTQVNLVVYRGGAIRGRLVSSPAIQSLKGVRLGVRSKDASAGSLFDENGTFDMPLVLPGSYSFELFQRDQPFYLKQVRCAGRDYTLDQMTIAPEQVISDCEVIVADDVGGVNGRTGNGVKSNPDLTAVLIPAAAELRKLARYTTTTKVAGDGHFTFANVIPGDYLLFIVPPSSDEQPYFAADFVDKHGSEALPVKIAPHQDLPVTITK